MTGPKNCITDIPGLKIGQAEDAAVKTGVSVILPDMPARASVDVRGGGPGTREISALTHGAAGAGFGAMAGIYPGGTGTASEVVKLPRSEITVGAIIAANPVGSPYLPGTQCPYAWMYEAGGEFGGVRPPADYKMPAPDDTKLDLLAAREAAGGTAAGQSTVIGCVAISVAAPQSDLKRIAIMAQDGLAMAVQPSHTPLDGDTIFTLGVTEFGIDSPPLSPVTLSLVGAAAARTVARALTRGVIKAR